MCEFLKGTLTLGIFEDAFSKSKETRDEGQDRCYQHSCLCGEHGSGEFTGKLNYNTSNAAVAPEFEIKQKIGSFYPSDILRSPSEQTC